MRSIWPPEGVHALDIEALRQPNVTFWSVWDSGELTGCGSLKELNEMCGEIRSMRASQARLREGVARTPLAHILEEAGRRGYREVCLETGSQDDFTAARQLDASFGFIACGPFADYTEDPNSVFTVKQLWPRGVTVDTVLGLTW